MPKVPPLVIATVARGSKENTEELHKTHTQLVNLLHSHSIHPLSLSLDGHVVERNLMRRIVDSATEFFTHTISNTRAAFSFTLKIPLFFGFPSVPGQDSKHSLKTSRNQLQTGAHFLSLGNFTAYYAQLRDITADVVGPLFR
jgi:hypothetical protein